MAATANGTVGNPRSARNCFSRARCCEMCSASGDGRTATSDSMALVAALGTFSNSKVTTSTRRANARSASRSSYGAVTSTSATCPVGVSESGEKVWTR